MLTGEFGCGKTLLSRALLNGLEEDQYQSALIINPTLTPLQLLGEIAFQLGAEESFRDRISMMDALGGILMNNHEKGKSSVIIIDEAQLIKRRDAFEELRVLLNYQVDQRFLLTLILLGPPELRDRINRLRALKQRISIRCHVGRLDRDEVASYINHRLMVAGRQEPLFTKSALDTITDYSGAVPRIINNICDMCLLIGFIEKAKKVDESSVEMAAEELEEFG